MVYRIRNKSTGEYFRSRMGISSWWRPGDARNSWCQNNRDETSWKRGKWYEQTEWECVEFTLTEHRVLEK